MKQTFFCVVLILAIFKIDAQDLSEGLVINDLALHPMQDLDKPGYLQTVIDPSFGTTIRRISNAPVGEFVKPVYSTIQAWNFDESLMFLYDGETGSHQLLDGTTYEYIRHLDDISPDDIEQLFWSFSDPDILYYLESVTDDFIEYNVLTESQTVLANLDVLATNCSGAISLGNDVQMMSWDSDVISFRCNNDYAYYYRISTGDLVEFEISNVSYTAPMPGPSGTNFFHQQNVYDEFGAFQTDLNASSGEHACLGQMADGTDGYFAVAFAQGPQGGCLGNIVAHNLETGNCYNIISQDQGYDYPKSGTHISALSYKNTQGGWLAASMIGFEQDGQALLDQELVIARADEDDIIVCRIGHHRSDEDQFDYWGEPHASISPSGTRVVFASDWSGDEDGLSVDTYVVELPAYNPPGGTGCEEFDSNDGESGWGIWNDGGADANLSSNASYANSGTRSFLIKDNTGSSVITTDDLDLSNAAEVVVDFNFITTGFNNASQDFWLQISTDGGASFTTVESWVNTVDFTNNNREFVSSIIYGPFTANTQLRFRCDATANNDKVYIDDIVIDSCEESSADCSDGVQNGGEIEIDCGGEICASCQGCYVKDENDLEVGLGTWIDGGVDARRNTLDMNYAKSGIYCVRLQDDTSESKITSGVFDMSSNTYAQIDFSYITSSMEAGEGFVVQYSTDGGSSFSTIGSFELNEDFTNGVREDVSVSVNAPFSNETRFRFKSNGNNNSDRVYLDDIVIQGCYYAPATTPKSIVDSRNKEINRFGFEMHPNPVSTTQLMTINIDSQDTSVNMQIIDLLGNLITNKTIVLDHFDSYQFETNTLTEGTYIIRIGNQENYEVKKFVVIK